MNSNVTDKTWSHFAAVWDRTTHEVYIYQNSIKVGTKAVQGDWYLADRSPTLYDIGLKRDTGETMDGFLGDVMVLGEALNEDGVNRILGMLLSLIGCFLCKHCKISQNI